MLSPQPNIKLNFTYDSDNNAPDVDADDDDDVDDDGAAPSPLVPKGVATIAQHNHHFWYKLGYLTY